MKHYLDWSAYQDAGLGDAYADVPKQGDDFAKAVAVCINSGQCEQSRKGVMCPSFRVTENPHLSPGGRVRLLKAALNEASAELADQAFQQAALQQAMELCLACKGCKRECENNIDMAMIKTEYLAQIYANSGIPLRTRLLANLPVWLERSSLLMPLLRWRNRSSVLAWFGEKLLGISAKRVIPIPVSKNAASLESQCNSEDKIEKTDRGEVVLLIDTFSRHYAPQAIDAAMTVLQRAGYRVFTTDMAEGNSANHPLCCGRTYIAHGLVDEAKNQARQMLAALKPHVDAGRKVIGLEPACLLAVRDDYRFLGLGELAEQVSKQALLFEEFVAREYSAGRFKLEFSAIADTNQKILVHGHCHQKAVGAMKAMRKVLKMIPQLDFEMVEASCCGMAGSFGLEQEHAELSIQMAEQDLFPRLREQPEAKVVANGFSCQQQIHAGLKRPSMHIAELLQALSDD